jgi:hypothetical protein
MPEDAKTPNSGERARSPHVGTSSGTSVGDRPTQIRDLVLWADGATTYVVACDSNASAGEKPSDRLKQSPEVTGYSVAKVPLMEVIAAGATPFLLVNTLCVALDDYGKAILAGIRRAISEAGY